MACDACDVAVVEVVDAVNEGKTVAAAEWDMPRFEEGRQSEERIAEDNQQLVGMDYNLVER